MGLADTPIGTVQIGPHEYMLNLQQIEEIRNVPFRHSMELPIGDSTVNTVAAYVVGRSSGDVDEVHLASLFDALGLGWLDLEHSRRVARLSYLIADVAGLDAGDIGSIELAALIHDIGKAWVPKTIRIKRTTLNDFEWSIMKLHPELGSNLLNQLTDLKQESAIVRFHHERFDGRGYPLGLRKDRIPLGARVIAIADTVDAMMSHRPYRRGQDLAVAREEISRLSGAQFDPEFARCLDALPDQTIRFARSNRDMDAGERMIRTARAQNMRIYR